MIYYDWWRIQNVEQKFFVFSLNLLLKAMCCKKFKMHIIIVGKQSWTCNFLERVLISLLV